LAETRTKVVFGVGADDADLMFVGEAPGRNEDLQGEPFVGAAGRLLDSLLDEAGIGRDRVYIANVLKCRPPGNRDPRPDEIDSCKGFLASQLELVDPRVVVTLGNFATKLLLKTDTGITRLRGTSYRWWRDKVLVPTYHPAAALRGGDRITDLMREDFDIMRAALDSPVSESAPPETAPAAIDDPQQLGLFG
jgi:uracil-DNA glycosylase